MPYKVKFDTGEVVTFQNQPTDVDIEEVVKKLGIKPKNATIPTEQKLKPKQDLLGTTTNVLRKIFPGEQVGKAIGTLGGYAYVKAKDFIKGTDTAKYYDLSSPSLKQVAGDIVSGAASVAGVKGVGVAGSFTKRILANMGLGGAIVGGQTLAEGGGLKETAKNMAIGGAIGGAIPVVGIGLSVIGKQISQLPARFVNSALGRSKAEILKDISKDKIDDFAKYVVQNKNPLKTASAHLGESQDAVRSLNTKVDTLLEAAVRKSGVKKTIGVNNFLDQIAKTPEAEGALLKRADVKEIVERLAPQTKKLLLKSSLTLPEANKLRQLVDTTLGDRAFLGGQLTSDKVILKNFANNLRELVKQKAPEETRATFLELTNEIRFRDGLLDRIAKRGGNQVLSFGDFIGGGLGGIFGGGIGGAVLGVGARRAIESVPFKLTSAKVINALTKAEPFLESLTPTQQTVILNLFGEIFSPDQDK